jgi:hypothetical protein
MKILKQGKWTHVFTCGGCKSELEAESDDVTYDVVGSFDDYTGRFQVKCPVCGDLRVLTTGHIPAETHRVAVAAYYKQKK